jgi:hypothetical protein
LTSRPIDGRGQGGYLRAVKFQLPPRRITLATALASVVCVAGGFFVGSRSPDLAVPDAVLFAPAKATPAKQDIVVPDPIDIPKR